METITGVTKYFGKNLAELLSEKIIIANKGFDQKKFIRSVVKGVDEKTLVQRVEWIADNLKIFCRRIIPMQFLCN